MTVCMSNVKKIFSIKVEEINLEYLNRYHKDLLILKKMQKKMTNK